MFKPKYPKLKEIQTAIAKTGFLNRLTPDDEPRAALLALGPHEWRNVTLIGKDTKRPKTSVRLFLNGSHIYFIKTPQSEYLHACRVADFAQLFFWKYRLRGGDTAPRDAFNFALTRAKLDQEHESGLRQLFFEYEAALIEVGILPSAEQLEVYRQRATIPRAISLRKQVENFPASFAKLEARLTNIETALAILLKKNP